MSKTRTGDKYNKLLNHANEEKMENFNAYIIVLNNENDVPELDWEQTAYHMISKKIHRNFEAVERVISKRRPNCMPDLITSGTDVLRYKVDGQDYYFESNEVSDFIESYVQNTKVSIRAAEDDSKFEFFIIQPNDKALGNVANHILKSVFSVKFHGKMSLRTKGKIQFAIGGELFYNRNEGFSCSHLIEYRCAVTTRLAFINKNLYYAPFITNHNHHKIETPITTSHPFELVMVTPKKCFRL